MNTHPVVANGGLPSMPPQLSSGFPASGIQSTSLPFVQQVGGDSSNQPWSSSIAPVGQRALNIPAGQLPQAVAGPGVEVVPGSIQKSSSEVKTTGRHALPEDLFAPSYLYSVRSPAWQAGPLHGFPYNIQHNAPRPMQSVPQLSKSTNPFDFSNDLAPTQPSTFPSMAPLQGSLPNIGAPTNTLHNSEAWMLSQSSYPLAMSLPAQSFASAMPPSAYMGQQMSNNLFPGQGLGGDPLHLDQRTQISSYEECSIHLLLPMILFLPLVGTHLEELKKAYDAPIEQLN